MEDTTFRNFFQPSKGWLVAAAVSGCTMLITGLVVLKYDSDILEWLLMMIGVQWPTFIMLIIHYCKKAVANRWFSKLEESGEYAALLADFQSAVPVLKEKVRLGYRYIYVKGKRVFVSYSDICKLYQYVHKTNHAEDRRQLHYLNPKGKKKVLCNLELSGKSDQDVLKIMTFVRAKNPSVHLGYK